MSSGDLLNPRNPQGDSSDTLDSDFEDLAAALGRLESTSPPPPAGTASPANAPASPPEEQDLRPAALPKEPQAPSPPPPPPAPSASPGPVLSEPTQPGEPKRPEAGSDRPSGHRYYQSAPRRSLENPFTGVIDVPESNEEFEQQFTPLGLPSTDHSWGLQNRIDGGMLRLVHDLHFLRLLPSPELTARGIDRERYELLGLPEPDLSPTEYRLRRHELSALVRRFDADPALRLLFARMHKKEFTAYQMAILDAYVAQAAAHVERAVFFLDLLPTELGKKDWLDFAPNNFMVGRLIAEGRYTSIRLASESRRRGRMVFGLVVPYSNTVANILYRGGRPEDGSVHLGNYVRRITGKEARLLQVAVGYSQGSTAVLMYCRQCGSGEGLGAAVALAPMGGNDGSGATGVHMGELGHKSERSGVPTLAITHAKDLAAEIRPDNVLPGAMAYNFSRRTLLNYHGGIHHGGNQPQPELGTKGYPLDEILPLAARVIYEDLGRGPYRKLEEHDWSKEIPGFCGAPVEELLTSRRLDGAISPAAAEEALRLILGLPEHELVAQLATLDEVHKARLLSNLPNETKTTDRYRRLLTALGPVGLLPYVSRLLSYTLFDWKIREYEVAEVRRVLAALPPDQRAELLHRLGDLRRARLERKLRVQVPEGQLIGIAGPEGHDAPAETGATGGPMRPDEDRSPGPREPMRRR